MTHSGAGRSALPGSGFQLPRFDFRSDGQIEREIDEEIAFHLESLSREFAAEGATPEQSRTRAIERFGDIDAIKSQCRRIALEDRIMLQKINLVIMLIVLAAVIGVCLYVVVTQKHNTMALQAITSEITNMKFEAEGASRTQAAMAEQSARAAMEQAQHERERAEAVTECLQSMLAGTDPAQTDRISILDLLSEAEQRIPATFADQPEVAAKMQQAIAEARERAMVDPDGAGRISITSNVSGPVQFDLPKDREFTLRELVSKELPREGAKAVTTLYRSNGGRNAAVASLTSMPDGTIEGTDAALQGGDQIDVKVESTTELFLEHRGPNVVIRNSGGFWKELNPEGQFGFADNGATLRLLARDDIRNLAGHDKGVLHLPESGVSYVVELQERVVPPNLTVMASSRSTPLASRWKFEDGTLHLNIGGTPISLRKQSSDVPARKVRVEGNVERPGEVTISSFEHVDPVDCIRMAGGIPDKPATIELHRQIGGKDEVVGTTTVE